MNQSFISRSLGHLARLGLGVSMLAGCPVDEIPNLEDSSSGGSAGSDVCTPGEQITCSCPGTVDGIQVCLPDGSGYDLCQCGDPLPDDSSTSGASASGSTTVAPTTTATESGTSTDTGETTEGPPGTTGTTGTTTDMPTGMTGPVGTTGTTGGFESSGTTTGGGVCDMYMGGAGTMCDQWLQDCPAGQKCIAYAAGGGSWDATQCTPVDATPGQVGDPCTAPNGGAAGEDDCDLGLMCWSVDVATNMGTCVALCEGCPDEPSCADPGSFCAIANSGILNLCLPGCDPLLQDCPGGEACYPVGDAFLCAPDVSGGAGFYGDPCEFINVCQPGLICEAPAAVPGCVGASGCCTEVCDLSNPLGDMQCAGFPGGQACVPWYPVGTAPPGYEDVGVCTL